MGVVGRLDQYASMLATEFDETTANNMRITGLGTYYASEFVENIVDIVRDGLVLNLDAGNLSSYPGSGTTWTDVSGRSNNGTLVNGPTYNSSNGGSIVFDGVDDYGSISHTTTLNPGTGDFTFGGFFKVNSGVASNFFPVFFSKSQLDWQNGYLIRPTWPYNGTFIVGVSQGGSTGVDRTTISSTLTASLGTWVNIVGVWTASIKTLKLYFNGVEDGSSTITNSITINPTVNLELGRYNRISQSRYEYLPGNIASVSIYNRALTAAEIQQNYNALATRYGLTTTSSTAPMSANISAPYDPVYDEFGGTFFGAGQGRYMRQNTDKSVIVYNEIDEITDLFGRGIVRDGLVLDLDAGVSASYPGSGTTWTDLSVYGNTGTLTNGPTYSASNSGYFILDGSNDYILANNTSLNSAFSSTSVSHFTWVYPTSAGQIVAELGQTTINTAWQDSNIEISSGGVFSFSTWHGSLTNKVTSTQSFNSWYYVGFSYNGTTLTAYVNGTSVGTTTFTRQAPYNNGYQTHYALCATDSTNMGTQGYAGARIASFSLYNRALTAAEIQQNYNALKHRFGL